ncbi:hypothetical protein V2J09_007804 [Rumex salicifolius]
MKAAREEEEGCGVDNSLEEDIYWMRMKRISFCIVFRSDSEDKLQIPKKFADNLKTNLLHSTMSLRGPSGATWEVNLIRRGNDLFLQDGWQEFVKAYSLQENDILIFKYDRNSSFNIKIFDGECEKVAAYFVKKCGHVYPAVKNQKKRVLSETVDFEDCGSDDEVCVATKKTCKNGETKPVNHKGKSKKILANRKRVQLAINFVRKKAASRSTMEQQGRDSHAETEPAKQHNSLTINEVPDQSGFEDTTLLATRGETELAKQPEQNVSIKKELTETITPGFEKAALPERRSGRPRIIEYISNRRPVTDEEKTNAMRKAALMLTDNSFFSAVPISSCYKHFFMTIPAKFAKVHLGPKNQDVILCMGEKKWTTKFSFSRGGLGSGWKQFSLENNLEESDVCLFKLINQENGEPVMLDVNIYRVVDEVTPLTLSVV